MNLVPTLDKLVGRLVAHDFWVNHLTGQNMLDRQNEGELSVAACAGRLWDEALRREPFWSILKRKGLAPLVRKSRQSLCEMFPKAAK